MSVIDYDLMTRYLEAKEQQNNLKNKLSGMIQVPSFMGNGYAEGGTFGGGSFYGSGAGGGWDEAPADTYNVNNFNQAFDAAVADGLKEFTFQGRRYNTQKENNPVREYNNRWVGQGRRANKKNPSKTYDHQAGPLGGPLADIPMVVDTHIGTPERPPLLEFNPNAMERGKSLPYSWSYTVDRPKKIQPAKAEVPLFAFGGDLQTNGSDFPTGLTYVNAGGSHEENPYDGVQMGVDPEGIPNLVEEGEVVFNDYVYSQRIELDDDAKEKFHFSKKKDITYADAAKKLEREIKERPNDPISQAAFKAQMADLAEEQERQKAEMDAARAREAFEALSPEEQTALMQQAAQQEQIAQEQAMQEQAMAEQAAAEQQPTPEEIAMAEQQQQMMQEVPTADAMGTVATAQPVMACGGRINKFDKGGMKQKIYNLLGLYTDDDFAKWAAANNVGDIDWDDITKNQTFIDALTKKDPSLKHVLNSGYDFGLFTPTASKGEISFKDREGNSYMNVGNWTGANDKKRPSATWNNSGDRMYREAIDILKERNGEDGWQDVWDNLTRPELENLFKETQAYKDTTQWLQSSPDNMRSYLRALSADPGFTDKGAVAHLEKFLDRKTNDWKEGINTSDAADLYSQIFGEKSGNAGRMYYPGNYWHTPSILNNLRDKVAKNFIIDKDGNISEMSVDVPEGWKAVHSYDWKDKTSDYTYNYYNRPDNAGNNGNNGKNSPDEAEDKDRRGVVPVHKHNVFGWENAFPLLSMAMMKAGVGKPDTSSLFAAADGAGNYTVANWMPRGDFAVYKPNDPWRYTNPITAKSNATDKNIMNTSSGNSGTARAAQLANSYNTYNALGEAALKGQDDNFRNYMAVKQYNGTIYGDNQKEYGQMSRFNANAFNDAARNAGHLRFQAANAAMDADAAFNQNWYGNLGVIGKNIGLRDRENRQRNMIADMAATGLFGQMTERTPIANGYLRAETDEEWAKRKAYQKHSGAKGGKIKRKKGFTY